MAKLQILFRISAKATYLFIADEAARLLAKE